MSIHHAQIALLPRSRPPVPEANVETIVVQAIQGLTAASILFLVAAGLSVIWGLMGILNFAHGSLYALGAYLGFATISLTGNYWAALLVAFLAVAVIGGAIQVGLLSRLGGRDPLYFFLLTFGLMYVLTEVIRIVWGDRYLALPAPVELSGSIDIGITFPIYRVFVIVISLVVAVGLWLILTRTDFGLLLRAGTQNRVMIQVLGSNIRTIFTLSFALGAGLAGVAGVLIAPMGSLYPYMGELMLLQSFVVVIIGGLGSYRGAALAALIVGEINAFGVLLVPGFSAFTAYLAMILVLLLRPGGLLPEGES